MSFDKLINELYENISCAYHLLKVNKMINREHLPARILFSDGVSLRLKIMGLSQRAAAKKCGISTKYICRIKDGSMNVTFDTAEKIAEGLGCTVLDLIELGLGKSDYFEDKELVNPANEFNPKGLGHMSELISIMPLWASRRRRKNKE